jgi:hypothetical protein
MFNTLIQYNQLIATGTGPSARWKAIWKASGRQFGAEWREFRSHCIDYMQELNIIDKERAQGL